MPKRSEIKSVLIVGAGPIVIGQACEFDYSGTQACKALREEGIEVILVNSNPATIMTDPNVADHTYVEPITVDIIEKIIAKHRPTAILPTVGGQTGLNVSLELAKQGVLEKYNVEMIGARPDAIEKAENRELFNKAMADIGLEVPKNYVVDTLEQGLQILDEIGLPAIIRPSFTLGGSGGGVANTLEEFKEIVSYGLDISPTNQVLIDECLTGWKEFEMEVIRDVADNAIIVCAIENIDPMGVHTGDSITVAPALTLTDKEYQRLRDASIAVLREIGVETGGSNVQFTISPKDGTVKVIEMNPRVSRSSALASKATGFPIAKVAAKLAIGYTLDEIQNDITKVTPASFEPTIDYVVTKMPRFTFEKFNINTPELSTSMKSVGEAMAIGRNFTESLQKAFRSMEIGLTGLEQVLLEGITKDQKVASLKEQLTLRSPQRILLIAQALREGISVEELIEITSYDRWFIEQINLIVIAENNLSDKQLDSLELNDLISLKKLGFSDSRIASLIGADEAAVFKKRHDLDIRPVYKSVDTCAAEFASKTSYLYSAYETPLGLGKQYQCESNPTSRKKVVILGGGPNRIGQGIEFDYACVHAAFALKEEGIESIMVNCNPETVSTDYDTSDKLYFEPLYREDVLEVIMKEQEKGNLLGVIVQFGGQTPLKLCKILEDYNIPVIGTSPDKIDLAEDRDRFRTLLQELDLKQPKNTIRYKVSEIKDGIEELGYPVVIRPSNVLGGRAMSILYSHEDLAFYLQSNESVLLDGPILIDKYLQNATEIDVDVLSDGQQSFVAGIMEHVEYAGVHSGDSACSIPSITISDDLKKTIEESSLKLSEKLEIVGLMNIQYAIYEGELYVIEVNPRASRTVPYVAKSTGNSIASIATKLMVGKKLSDFNLRKGDTDFYTFKECIFPFARFDDVDTILGPEMKSTGEVMGMDRNKLLAFAKAQISVGNFVLGRSNNIFLSLDNDDKDQGVQLAKDLVMTGYNLLATQGTSDYLKSFDVPVQLVGKEGEEEKGAILDMIENKEVELAIVTTINPRKVQASKNLRRAIMMNRIPYVTTMRSAQLMVDSILETKKIDFSVTSLQEV